MKAFRTMPNVLFLFELRLNQAMEASNVVRRTRTPGVSLSTGIIVSYPATTP